MKTPLLISMHMEKCAGTSTANLLMQQYPEGFQLYDPGHPDDHFQFNLKGNVGCLHGHMYYGLHRQFPEYDCRYITVLRDPVTRFYSNFQHIQRFEHPLHDLLGNADGLEIFCQDMAARHYRNLFVRRLAEVEGEPNARHVDVAEQRLRSFTLVGRAEAFNSFARKAGHIFQWPTSVVTHQNKNLKPQKISPAEEKMITAVNALDIELMRRTEDLLVS